MASIPGPVLRKRLPCAEILRVIHGGLGLVATLKEVSLSEKTGLNNKHILDPR